MELKPFSWERMIVAVENVRKRAMRASQALEAAGIPYAIAGGNAVAAWVARVDESAVRNTQDVDVLIRREDLERAKAALKSAGFYYRQVMGVDCFLDSEEGNPLHGVHLVFAGEKVKPDDLEMTARIDERIRGDEFDIVDLEPLVRMKLTAFRRKDQVHLADMIDVGIVDSSWLAKFDGELRMRLESILDDPHG